MLNDLDEFERVYNECVSVEGTAEYPALRSRAMAAAMLADRAMQKAGTVPFAVPPPAIGGPVMRGLLNMAFLFETPFSVYENEIPNAVRGFVAAARALVERALDDAKRRRRNPLYWFDRVVSALLGLPAYFLSRLIGVPRSNIEESRYGTVLRIAALVVDAGLVFVTGRAAKLW
jgi:hypothetical protein